MSVGGFLLYVLLSSFAAGLMNLRLFGHLTLGLALGLAQFAIMAITSWCYVRHMRTRVDPLARSLRPRLARQEPRPPHQTTPPQQAGQTFGQDTRGYRTW